MLGNWSDRRGLALAEVVVILMLGAVLLFGLLIALPRQRAAARFMSCRRNLEHLGQAVTLYSQAQGWLPAIPPLGSAPVAGSGPVAALLGALGAADFDMIDPPKVKPVPRLLASATVPDRRRIAGLICPDDRIALTSPAPAPVSYRAVAGSRSDGGDGAFAPGRARTLDAIEAADGLAFTALFEERLVGDGHGDQPGLASYVLVPSAVDNSACPALAPSSWRGDAGQDWSVASWVAALSNHTLTPNAQPSCVAVDGRTARLGASSAHEGGVQILRGDGSVGLVGPRVDPRVWRAWANIADRAASTVETVAPTHELAPPPTSRDDPRTARHPVP